MTGEMPSVSAVVPCFNARGFLARSLGSILSQSSPVTEIVLVDDGSSDGSADEAMRISAGAAIPLRIHRQANAGVAAARNAGVRLARGEAIAFLDADDRWPDDSVRLRLEALVAARAQIAFGRVRVCADGERRPSGVSREMPGRLAGSLLIERHVFAGVGGFDESLRTAETIEWIARASDAGYRSASVDAVVLERIVHGANMMAAADGHVGDRLEALWLTLRRRRAMAGR